MKRSSMKKLIAGKLLISAMAFTASASFAGDCVLSITRVACPGKETETYKPYNGQKTTEEKKAAADAGACKAMAEKASKIVRKGTLAEKSVKAKFDGKDVEGGKEFADKSECK